MKKIFVAIMAMAAMAACATDDVVRQNYDNAIEFNTFVGNSTKVATDNSYSNTAGNLEQFQVWGTIAMTGTANYANIFDGVVVNKGGSGVGSAWTYGVEYTQYWIPGNTYSFVGIVDGNEGYNSVVEGAYNMPTHINVDMAQQSDVLYATAGKDYVQGGAIETVHLQFAHLLAKAKFTVKNTMTVASGYSYTVEDIRIVNADAAGQYDIQAEAWTPGTGVYTADFGKVTADHATAKDLGFGAKEESDLELLLLPHAGKKLAIEVDYTLYRSGVKIQQFVGTTAKQVSATLDIEKGRAYNFVLEMGNPGEPITFDAEVEEWIPEGGQDTPVGYHINANGEYVVSTAAGLASIANEVAAGVATDRVVVLENDIDLNNMTRSEVASNWTPIGTPENPFTGTFDGNGCKIKNLTLVENEAIEGKVYLGFFGFADDATIKNVVFENAYINIPCLDINHSQGHIAVVAGSLEGTSLVENVTVQGLVQVYATLEANGASRVAIVAGGGYGVGDVTMRNVHVNVSGDSYLKANNNVGALAGQLQGKVTFENCSSNIDVTGYKFFAGGIIGLSAANSTFTNCHSTGDITILAGRSGNNNDHYRVGGIAGGWADNTSTPCVVTNCSYTGTISGTNADGRVAETLDCLGYVGRGYSTTVGSVVEIDGVPFKYLGNGEFATKVVSTVEELEAALAVEGATIYMKPGANYVGTKKFSIAKGVTIYGNGASMKNDWASLAFNKQCSLENVTIIGVNFTNNTILDMAYAKGEVHFKDCVFSHIRGNQSIHFDGQAGAKVVFDNCTMYGRNMLAATLDKVVLNNCKILESTWNTEQGNKGVGTGWSGVNMWGKYEFNNCQFDANCSLCVKGNSVEAELNNCTVTDGSALNDIIMISSGVTSYTVKVNGVAL